MLIFLPDNDDVFSSIKDFVCDCELLINQSVCPQAAIAHLKGVSPFLCCCDKSCWGFFVVFFNASAGILKPTIKHRNCFEKQAVEKRKNKTKRTTLFYSLFDQRFRWNRYSLMLASLQCGHYAAIGSSKTAHVCSIKS